MTLPSMGIWASTNTGKWGWEVRGVPGWADCGSARRGLWVCGVALRWLEGGGLACTPPCPCKAAEAGGVGQVMLQRPQALPGSHFVSSHQAPSNCSEKRVCLIVSQATSEHV